MISLRHLSSIVLLSFCVSCVDLNHPIDSALDTPNHAPSNTQSISDETRVSESDGEDPGMGEPLAWNDLTKLAREDRQRGQLVQASERLAKAGFLVEGLAPTHVSRRTVFSLRARLAIELAGAGELDVADDLVDELLTEAEANPLVGGSSLVSLALSVAERRAIASTQPEEEASQLALLRTAFVATQTGKASLDRLDLATMVARSALRENENALARTAIDQALSDADQITPTEMDRMIELQLQQARIALRGGDLDTAQASATAANQMLEETNGSASRRGIGEAVLAEILAAKGDVETALIIAIGARARIDGDQPMSEYAIRRILTAMARVERSTGDFDSARAHFEQALAVPGLRNVADSDLLREVSEEIGQLNNRQQ